MAGDKAALFIALIWDDFRFPFFQTTLIDNQTIDCPPPLPDSSALVLRRFKRTTPP
jgi:hypothetical protein